jgi:hypothetical protein
MAPPQAWQAIIATIHTPDPERAPEVAPEDAPPEVEVEEPEDQCMQHKPTH